MPPTILVALDGSPASRPVLDAATAIARREEARLWLYRAVAIPREIPTMALARTPDDVAALLEATARAELEGMASELPAALLGGVCVSVAIPWQGVCQAAQDLDANLVVIGSHGYGGWDRLLGTTAARIVNHCERSVLVVKPRPAA
jgi:nucleotide-binding universal stress UspA family protein